MSGGDLSLLVENVTLAEEGREHSPSLWYSHASMIQDLNIIVKPTHLKIVRRTYVVCCLLYFNILFVAPLKCYE